MPLSAQSAGELLSGVSAALAGGDTEQAVSLFARVVQADAAQAEMFYLTGVEKADGMASRMARILAAAYRERREYDKAFLFFREVLSLMPDDVPALEACAEIQLLRNKEEEAMKLYERLLQLDECNLSANIFMGNYLYLQAENERRRLEDDFHQIASPTRMQYARYRDSMDELFTHRYAKVRTYLLRVLQLFPSAGAETTLKHIEQMEQQMEHGR